MSRDATAAAAPTIIATAPGVSIRRKLPSDAADEYAWRTDPEIARFDAARPVAEPFEAFLAAFQYDLTFGRLGRDEFALEAADGTHIGTIMFYNSDGDAAEFGVSIALNAYRDSGLGRAAISAFLRYAWQNTGLRRLRLHTLVWNERAQHCFRACGFEDIARVERDGEWFARMEARREWWLLWDSEGRFSAPG
jgi:RimJ/RimL family protein N-acetyltransferase